MVFGQGFISTVCQTRPITPIKFHTKNPEQTATLQELVSAVSPEFNHGAYSVLNPLLFNGHAQTAYAAVGNFDNVDQVYYGRRILHFPDGGSSTADYLISKEQFHSVSNSNKPGVGKIEAGADYKGDLPPRTRLLTESELSEYANDPARQTKPLLVLLHGLSGGSFESYVRCVLSRLDTSEFDAVVLNARGCSLAKISTPQLFCGLWTDDIRFLVKDLKTQFPRRSLYGVGFSLGSTILSNYLGQEGADCPLTAACLLGNPWDMMESSFGLHSSLIGGTIYSPVMAKNLKKLVSLNFEQLSLNPVFVKSYTEESDKIKTLVDFDNVFTSRMFGFNNAHEYYRHASPVTRILNIRVPTLIINAADDPIVGSRAIPHDEVKKNPYLLLATTNYGGHLGWFKYNNERWYAQPLVEFFKGFHKAVQRDSATGKADIADEGVLPHKNCMVDDRLKMDGNPYYL